MARVPGIIFADGPCGRRARIAGSGLDVFEVIEGYLSVGRDRRRLETAYHWLTLDQLEAAPAYYEMFPDEIGERLAMEDAVTPELVREH
jgi:uncharacterized protein (DUF433 family)